MVVLLELQIVLWNVFLAVSAVEAIRMVLISKSSDRGTVDFIMACSTAIFCCISIVQYSVTFFTWITVLVAVVTGFLFVVERFVTVVAPILVLSSRRSFVRT